MIIFDTEVKISKNVLGEGSYGEVFSGYYIKDSKRKNCVVKVMRKRKNVSGFSNFNEIEILQKLGKNSPFIIDLLSVEITKYGTDNSKEHILLVMEVAKCDAMKYFVKEKYDFATIRKMCSHILLGLDHMHKKGICHRDLKSSNLLVFMKNNEPHIKITDFGFSTMLPFKGEREEEIHTIWYRAPEIMFRVNNYKITSDIWCVGIIFQEMFFKKHIFKPLGAEPTITEYMEFCVTNIQDEWTRELQREYRNYSSIPDTLVFGVNYPKKFGNGKNYFDSMKTEKYKVKGNVENRELSDFCNLINDCLSFNYFNRKSAHSLLTESAFFEPISEYILEMHNLQYSRRVHDSVNFSVPEEINEKKISFFKQVVEKLNGVIIIRHLFYSVDLINKFFTQYENYEGDHNDVFAACLYFVHKMFCFLNHPEDPEKFFIHKYNSGISEEEKRELDMFIYEFELLLVTNYNEKFGYIIRPSIYDMQNCYKDRLLSNECHNLDRSTLLLFFFEYCSITNWSKHSYRYMYRTIYKKIVDQNFEV